MYLSRSDLTPVVPRPKSGMAQPQFLAASVFVSFYQKCMTGVAGDSTWVFISDITTITSKQLDEQTRALLDRVKQGERFRILCAGEADALLVPASDLINPPWDDIMARSTQNCGLKMTFTGA